jgi:hypothetical protein
MKALRKTVRISMKIQETKLNLVDEVLGPKDKNFFDTN